MNQPTWQATWLLSRADAVKQFRIEHKLTQKQLAEKLGKSIRTITNWEAGTRNPEYSDKLALERIETI